MRDDGKTDRRRLVNLSRKAFMMLAVATSCKEAQDAKKNDGEGAVLNNTLLCMVRAQPHPVYVSVTSRHSAANFSMCAYIPQVQKKDISTSSRQKRHGSRFLLGLGRI